MDAFVVEAAACHAADFAVLGEPRRAGLAACRSPDAALCGLRQYLRLADGYCALGGPEAQGVYAVWTEDVLYLEFDEVGAPDGQCQRARTRVAALEAVSGRTVCVASSSARRGAA